MLADQARRLEDLTDLGQIWDAVQRTLGAEGIDFVIYRPQLLTNIPAIYEGFAPEKDPFLSHCCHSYAITPTGVAYLPDYGYLPDPAKNFIERAREAGFRTGMGIPMRLQGTSRFGGFNLGARLDRAAFEARLLPRREDFRLYCLLAHRRIEEVLQGTVAVAGEFPRNMIAPQHQEFTVLTPREREIAYLVAQGFSRKECARLCSISQHTVSDYLKSIYGKLGVNDRVRLAQVFLSAGATPD